MADEEDGRQDEHMVDRCGIVGAAVLFLSPRPSTTVLLPAGSDGALEEQNHDDGTLWERCANQRREATHQANKAAGRSGTESKTSLGGEPEQRRDAVWAIPAAQTRRCEGEEKGGIGRDAVRTRRKRGRTSWRTRDVMLTLRSRPRRRQERVCTRSDAS